MRDFRTKHAGLIRKLYFKMAGAAGFEPTHARIKTWCLTAWRRPYSWMKRTCEVEMQVVLKWCLGRDSNSHVVTNGGF